MMTPDTTDLLQQTLDGVSDAFMILDREWRFLHLNQAAIAWFKARMNIDATTVIGRELWKVTPQLVGTRFEREYRAARERLFSLEEAAWS